MKEVSLEELKTWYQVHHPRVLKDFFKFLSFPSISTDPNYARPSRETAIWLSEYLREIGLEATLWETSGLPVVFASLEVERKGPTLLIYHHYDVQPVDPLELWKSSPFAPEVREGQVFARGAADNKGQCFYSITAIKAFLQLAQEIGVNIKLFIEGEEESGGKGTAEVLQQKKGELKADHLLVVDFDMPAPNVPAITLGMRGIMTFQVECRNGVGDLHSGVHGGIALNPNRVLATILGSFWDDHGRVTIPSFYEDVASLSPQELSHIEMSFNQAEYEKQFGVKAFCGEKGFSLKESNSLRPTLEINGMCGGYTGPGFKTVIPAKAFAKISCRLVPHQDPEKIKRGIAEYLKEKTPSGIDLKIEWDPGAFAYRSSLGSSIVTLVGDSYREVFNAPCQNILCGASVPIVSELAKVSGAEVAMIGLGLPSDDIHAPNEHFGLDRFELGFLTMGRILSRLSINSRKR